jgi:hypothetical protein
MNNFLPFGREVHVLYLSAEFLNELDLKYFFNDLLLTYLMKESIDKNIVDITWKYLTFETRKTFSFIPFLFGKVVPPPPLSDCPLRKFIKDFL